VFLVKLRVELRTRTRFRGHKKDDTLKVNKDKIMGIKGLSRFLKRMHPNLYRPLTISTLRGKRMAIDVSVFLYQFTINMSYPKHYVDRFLNFLAQLRREGVLATCVFDGPACKSKGATLTQRFHKRERNFKTLERKISECVECEIEAVEKNARNFQDNRTITSMDLRVVDEIRCRKVLLIKKLTPINRHFLYTLQDEFTKHNIPFVVADLEAEKACAWLAEAGLVEYVASEDYDTLACGAPRMVCCWNNFIYRRRECQLILLSEVLRHLRVTYSQFVDICVFAGTDFNRPPVVIGFTRAIAIYQNQDVLNRGLLGLFNNTCRGNYLTNSHAELGYSSFEAARELLISPGFPFVRSILVSLVYILALKASLGISDLQARIPVHKSLVIP
jgi:5'-3' exonuclease